VSAGPAGTLAAIALDPALTVPPYLAAAGLLAVAGAAKLRSPAGAGRALAGAGLPSAPAWVRAVGAVEVAVGVGALLAPRPLAPAVAAVFLGFAAFVGAALAGRITVASCGCLGERELPPGRFHLGLNLLAAAAAVLVALTPVGDWREFLAAQPWNGVPLAMLTAVGTATLAVALAHLPEAMGAYRPAPAASGPGAGGGP
jgi:hypothetical protein